MEPVLERFPWLQEILPLIGYIILTLILISAYHIIANQVKSIFILRKQKKDLFDDLYFKVEKLLDRVKDIVEGLGKHTDAIQKLEDNLADQIDKTKASNEAYVNRKIGSMRSQLAKLERKEEEHFKSLKGSYDKQYDKVKDLEKEIEIIKVSHNHHHPENPMK